MINQQPALIGFDWNRAGPDFFGLPGGFITVDGTHHITVFPPERKIRAYTVKNISKRRVPRIARTADHSIIITDFAREQYPVAVIWQKGIFQLVERFEVSRIADSDGWAMVAVAPGNIIAFSNLNHPRIITVLPFGDFRVAFKHDWLVIDRPIHTIITKSGENIHAHRSGITAEHASELAFEWNDGGVEYTVGIRNRISLDDRIGRITPDWRIQAGRLILPRDIF
ncbi:hypothetical protein D3C77_316580 [compost metagenome]